MKSKVIQICTVARNFHHYLYALCEDGTIWINEPSDGNWSQIKLDVKTEVDSDN